MCTNEGISRLVTRSEGGARSVDDEALSASQVRIDREITPTIHWMKITKLVKYAATSPNPLGAVSPARDRDPARSHVTRVTVGMP
jgi:hypothetical protein